MNQSYQTRLAEILDYLGESYYPMHEYPDQPIYTDRNKEAIAEAQQQITELFLEIIGEDVEEDPEKGAKPVGLDIAYDYSVVRRAGQNSLRWQIRKAISEETKT